ncbi:scaffolding protein [Brevibacillus agri]|uniref:phage scaffolding protein n=1 Tax=Brevibacillus agri TaxID=51101 RepID=UPI001EE617FA|nr:scaffolding protein [Brevibacillus agri]MCG5252616.1 scaffolding protein [Brevibacillus agri]
MHNAKFRFPVNLQYFSEPEPDPQTDAAGDEPQAPAEPTKTFTQEELDKIVADRIARERKKLERYADYDDLKRKAEEYEKAEAERKKAEMTAQERLEAEKAEAQRKAQEAEENAQRALASANQRLIKSEFKLLAKEAGIRADALEDAFRLADVSGVSVDEDGNVDGVKAVVEALIANKPYLVEQPKKDPKPIGGPTGYSATDEMKTLEAQLEAAKKKRDFGLVLELSNKIKQALR